jgi:Holliday junction resolvase RusA-like endonuclease
MISFIIPGEPMGKQRARTTKWGSYTPEKTVNYETLVKVIYKEKYPKQELIYTPIKMSINAYLGIVKSTPKKNIPLMLNNTIRPTKKPDIDNIAKIILDALNGICYKDDTQVISLTLNKYYGLEPKVEVYIEGV